MIHTVQASAKASPVKPGRVNLAKKVMIELDGDETTHGGPVVAPSSSSVIKAV